MLSWCTSKAPRAPQHQPSRASASRALTVTNQICGNEITYHRQEAAKASKRGGAKCSCQTPHSVWSLRCCCGSDMIAACNSPALRRIWGTKLVWFLFSSFWRRTSRLADNTVGGTVLLVVAGAGAGYFATCCGTPF